MPLPALQTSLKKGSQDKLKMLDLINPWKVIAMSAYPSRPLTTLTGTGMLSSALAAGAGSAQRCWYFGSPLLVSRRCPSLQLMQRRGAGAAVWKAQWPGTWWQACGEKAYLEEKFAFFIPLGKVEGVQDLSRVFLHEKNGMQEIYFNSKPVQCDIFLYLFHLYVASVRMAT